VGFGAVSTCVGSGAGPQQRSDPMHGATGVTATRTLPMLRQTGGAATLIGVYLQLALRREGVGAVLTHRAR
jgi:hypothetical protein